MYGTGSTGGTTLLSRSGTIGTLNIVDTVRHRLNRWNIAAVQVWAESHIAYLMLFAAAHVFAEVQKWPIDGPGKDLRIIKNQTDGPVSLFVHGSRENFMGVWNP